MMFHRLGLLVSRHPWAVIAAWLVGAAAIVIASGRLAPGTQVEPDSFLPAHSEQRRALTLMLEAFPELAGRSQMVLVAHRQSGLEKRDLDYLGNLAAAVRRSAMASERGWKVLSPTETFLDKRLISRARQVAMLVVNIREFYASKAAAEGAARFEELAAPGRPEGLAVHMTGGPAGARDYAASLKPALKYTKWVTVGCVLVILLLIYRSPVAAAVPIVGIGICTVLALKMLDLFGLFGLYVTDMERMFTIVLLYGAGTDFAMFWLARYREEWAARGAAGRREAVAVATERVGPAIVASAGTTILGLLSLVATQMIPTQNAGKVLGVILCWAPLAGTTLIPAVVCVLGGAIFWPRPVAEAEGRALPRLWTRVGKAVVGRPATMLVLGLAVLLPAAVRAGFINFRYDTLSELPRESSSYRGAMIAHEHFSQGVLYPMTMLVRSSAAKRDDARMRSVTAAISKAVAEVEGVEEVYTAANPLGSRSPVEEGFAGTLIRRAAEGFYLSGKTSAARVEIVLRSPPFSAGAMEAAQEVRRRIEAVVRSPSDGLGANAGVYALGATPYILEVRRFMNGDQWRVWIGATFVIWLTVALMVRQAGLSLFMVGATLVTYATTLGLSHEFFTHVMGGGLDYKVKIFLFVIIVAVGQDYNIFLVTRLRQEVEQYGDDEGTLRAIVRTGGVISSCGVIMAATLGSLWVGRLELLRQLAFALALGMLIDTFIVRPLLVPSYWLWARRRRRRGIRARSASEGGMRED